MRMVGGSEAHPTSWRQRRISRWPISGNASRHIGSLCVKEQWTIGGMCLHLTLPSRVFRVSVVISLDLVVAWPGPSTPASPSLGLLHRDRLVALGLGDDEEGPPNPLDVLRRVAPPAVAIPRGPRHPARRLPPPQPIR